MFNDVEHRHAHGRLQGAGRKGIEVATVLTEGVHQVRTGNHSRKRQTVAHRFAHGRDVRHDLHHLVTPPVSGAAKTGLDLISDKQPARMAHQCSRALHEACRDVW